MKTKCNLQVIVKQTTFATKNVDKLSFSMNLMDIW